MTDFIVKLMVISAVTAVLSFIGLQIVFGGVL